MKGCRAGGATEWKLKTVAVLLFVCSLVVSARADRLPQYAAADFLTIWPTSRGTSMSGAMTALADDPGADYWNPGGLGFQRSLGLETSTWPLEPYSHERLNYLSAGLVSPRLKILKSDLNVGLSLTYLDYGAIHWTNSNGDTVAVWRTINAAPAVHAGVKLFDKLGVGLNIKFIYEYLCPDAVWPEIPKVGFMRGGTGIAAAADLGVLYRPFRFLSLGAALVNIGPDMTYSVASWHDALPRALRVGIAAMPLDGSWLGTFVRPRLAFDWEKTLLTNWVSQKAVGIEVTLLQVLTLRAGSYGYALTNPVNNSVGIGLGYKDYVRLDFSDNRAFYEGWGQHRRLSLVVNDLAGLVRELKRHGRS